MHSGMTRSIDDVVEIASLFLICRTVLSLRPFLIAITSLLRARSQLERHRLAQWAESRSRWEIDYQKARQATSQYVGQANLDKWNGGRRASIRWKERGKEKKRLADDIRKGKKTKCGKLILHSPIVQSSFFVSKPSDWMKSELVAAGRSAQKRKSLLLFFKVAFELIIDVSVDGRDRGKTRLRIQSMAAWACSRPNQ